MVQQYSENESLERIYRMLSGGSDPPDLEGTLGQMPRNEALARIAGLLEGSLAFTAPSTTKATDAQMVAGTSDAVFVTPDKLDHISMFGGIYTWTGTVTLTGLTVAWTKMTGMFQNSMVYSGVTCQPTQDRMFVNDAGIWEVSWQMSFIGSPDIVYKVEPYCFVGMPQAAASTKPYASGSVVSMSGSGYILTSGTSQPVSLYIYPDTTAAWIVPVAVQLSAKRLGKWQ